MSNVQIPVNFYAFGITVDPVDYFNYFALSLLALGELAADTGAPRKTGFACPLSAQTRPPCRSQTL
jgi:hypothetical protein